MEDNYGDMDFKIAGTSEGITAVQMDTKIKGLSTDIIETTVSQAREARLYILEEMSKTIATSRPELSRFAPRMYKIMIPVDKIGAVIGPGGKVIRGIIEETKTTIDIEDDGTVLIGSNDEASAKKAMDIVSRMTREVEIGSVYTGKVTRILSFGAFVEILPGKEGMVHISELADYRVEKIEDEVKVGDEITVVVIRVEDGKVALSRKALFEKTKPAGEAGVRGPSGPRPDRRGPPRDRFLRRPQ
jgi:polyribonucleotide nucleotidyltransferase